MQASAKWKMVGMSEMVMFEQYTYRRNITWKSHIHKGDFQHFAELRFSFVLNYEILFSLVSCNFRKFHMNSLKSMHCFSLKITKNWKNCHIWSSRFTQKVKQEITFTFTLNSCKFKSPPITYLKYAICVL